MKPIEYFQQQLISHRPRIEKDLRNANSGYTHDEFINYCMNALRENQGLLDCDPDTVTGAFLHCASMGLMPNTPFNHITIRPYYRNHKDENDGQWYKKKEARVLIGYQGWIEIIYKNNRVIDVDAVLVHVGDHFKVIRGFSPNIEHIQKETASSPVRFAVYAFAWLKGATFPVFTVLYKNDIDKFREISMSSDRDNDLWKDEEKDPMGWMWKKTAIKQLAKQLPKSKFLDQTITLDNLAETGVGSVYVTKDGDIKLIDNTRAKTNARTKKRNQKSKDIVDGLLFRKNQTK